MDEVQSFTHEHSSLSRKTKSSEKREAGASDTGAFTSRSLGTRINIYGNITVSAILDTLFFITAKPLLQCLPHLLINALTITIPPIPVNIK